MAGSRNTLQRRVILEELCRVPDHPSAPELYTRVRHRLPRISLGTVYRNLELLVRQGQVRRLEGSGGGARFDGDPHDHAHLHCVVCGAVLDLEAVAPGLSFPPPQAPSEALILGMRVEVVGICPGCRSGVDAERTEALRRAWS